MEVALYNNSSDNRVMNKSLQFFGTVEAHLKGDCSISEPLLELDRIDIGIVKDVNYFYIPKWSRYYFVTDITVSTGNTVVINGRVDVLSSNKSAILSTNAYIVRNEFDYSPDIVDDNYTIQGGKAFDYHNVHTISTSGGRYYLSTL